MSLTLILANLAPLFLALGSITAFAWFLDALMGPAYRPSNSSKDEKDPEKPAEPGIDWRRGLVRLVGVFGIPVGILCFASLVSILLNPGLTPYGDLLTIVLLIWVGIALFLTPFNKLPWAALIGLVAGIIAVIVTASLSPIIPDWITGQIPLNYVLIAIFIIVGVVVFTLFRWAENIIDLLTAVLGSRPALLLLAFIAMAQAIALPVVWLVFGGMGGLVWFFIH
jgi:hypothetical protein